MSGMGKLSGCSWVGRCVERSSLLELLYIGCNLGSTLCPHRVKHLHKIGQDFGRMLLELDDTSCPDCVIRFLVKTFSRAQNGIYVV